MEEEFVTYEQALALKELDYDEPCLAKFVVPYDLVLPGNYENTDVVCATITQNDICEAHILAPTKSQVFRWFREKFDLQYNIVWNKFYDKTPYQYEVRPTWRDEPLRPYGTSGMRSTYEEAESACIDKLIELIKQQKDEHAI